MSDVFISEETLDRLGKAFRASYGTETLYTTEQMISLATENRLRKLLKQELNELTPADMQGVTAIRKFQFQHTLGLQRVTIPNSVTSIGCDAFRDCSDLIEVVIPDSVTSTEWSTFQGCSSLQSAVIGNGVTTIGSSDFESCTSLTQVVIGSGVTTLETSAFRGCTSLAQITIPDNVTTLSGTVFQLCTSLVDVTVGRGVTSIGSQALAVGSEANKATLEFLCSNPPAIQSDAFNTSYLQKIIVPSGCSSAYKKATNWARYADYIKEKEE